MRHDLPEAEKHCGCCGKDLRLFDEEFSERYEYISASIKVIENMRRKYACDCTVKTADKPAQPIEKSTAGASMLAHVIMSKFADHQPLHRQERMFERQGGRISRKTMGGWMARSAGLLEILYRCSNQTRFASKVIGTDDTGVKVLDPKLPFARTGRIWPYLGDAQHPVVVHHYTPTRGRDGPAKFLEGHKGYLQADAYCVYDAFFKPARGLVEVGCMMHMRRYFYKALDSDEERMGKALHLIARLYGVEDRAKGLSAEERLALRRRLSAPVMRKLHVYLLQIREEVLPKSPAARAVRYALNQWDALTRFLEDGDLEIDNGATERANRDVAIGRGNWTFFGSDEGGKTGREHTLFTILHVLRRLDMKLAESLISEHEQLAAAASRFPNGMESVMDEAERRRSESGAPSSGGYGMAGDPRDFPYMRALLRGSSDRYPCHLTRRPTECIRTNRTIRWIDSHSGGGRPCRGLFPVWAEQS